MTIEKRIQALLERHEALTASLELQVQESAKKDQQIEKLALRMDNLTDSVIQLHRHADHLRDLVAQTSNNLGRLTNNVDNLTTLVIRMTEHLDKMSGAMEKLVHITEMQNRRMDWLEGTHKVTH
jgi:chromosome segregation ATPase